MSSPPTNNMTDSSIASSEGSPEVGYGDFGVTPNAIWPGVMAGVVDEVIAEVSTELMAEVAAWMVA